MSTSQTPGTGFRVYEMQVSPTHWQQQQQTPTSRSRGSVVVAPRPRSFLWQEHTASASMSLTKNPGAACAHGCAAQGEGSGEEQVAQQEAAHHGKGCAGKGAQEENGAAQGAAQRPARDREDREDAAPPSYSGLCGGGLEWCAGGLSQACDPDQGAHPSPSCSRCVRGLCGTPSSEQGVCGDQRGPSSDKDTLLIMYAACGP